MIEEDILQLLYLRGVEVGYICLYGLSLIPVLQKVCSASKSRVSNCYTLFLIAAMVWDAFGFMPLPVCISRSDQLQVYGCTGIPGEPIKVDVVDWVVQYDCK